MLWENNVAETVTHNMGYNNGLLLVEQGGYYHLYSKLTLRAAEKSCSLIQHKVMKKIVAYDKPIELMSSKRLVGVTTPYFLPLLEHMCSQLLTVVQRVCCFVVCVFKGWAEISAVFIMLQ